MTPTIGVRDLRVGMYVHLDLGWMSHPFSRASFKISNPEQINKIRALGLAKVRWCPEKSDHRLPPDEVIPAPAADLQAQQLRRAALTAQRAGQAEAERRYDEAARAWREMSHSVRGEPQAARHRAEALARLLLEQMVPDQELCIRLLTEGAADNATAHALNVGILSLLMGRAFRLADEEMLDLGIGALLHDIGKLEVPDRLRFPDDQFNAEEMAAYRDHVARGVQHGRHMGLAPGALLVIGQHHEQADGSGFPQQLPVERMSGSARIVALINRYDNLCNPALLSKAMTPHEALSVLFAQGRQKFDATMLAGFVRMMGVYPPGSLVQLTDDRFGLVTSVNSSRPLKPRVLVHDPRVPADEALHVDLERAADIGIRRSMKAGQLPPEALAYLSPGRRLTYFFEPVLLEGEAASVPEAVA